MLSLRVPLFARYFRSDLLSQRRIVVASLPVVTSAEVLSPVMKDCSPMNPPKGIVFSLVFFSTTSASPFTTSIKLSRSESRLTITTPGCNSSQEP